MQSTNTQRISNETTSKSRSQEKQHNHSTDQTDSLTVRTAARKGRNSKRFGFLLIVLIIAACEYLFTNNKMCKKDHQISQDCFISGVSGHIVLTRDDNGQSLVLTGGDGKGGKGKGKGKGGDGDRLVIAGNMGSGGGGKSSNMIMENAGEREGDVVISGNSMLIPGEDGHIVLADNRAQENGGNRGPRGPPPNLMAFWMPYLYNGYGFRTMQSFYGGGQFG